MLRLASVLAIVAICGMTMVAGCGSEGERGDVCDVDEDCTSDLVCISQVLNCAGEACFGACEAECVDATDCDAGDTCHWIGHQRVCRSDTYQLPDN